MTIGKGLCTFVLSKNEQQQSNKDILKWLNTWWEQKQEDID
jgi:hypothetical protein